MRFLNEHFALAVGAFNTTRTNHTLVCLPDPFTDVAGKFCLSKLHCYKLKRINWHGCGCTQDMCLRLLAFKSVAHFCAASLQQTAHILLLPQKGLLKVHCMQVVCHT